MVKISFLGDVLCEGPYLRAASLESEKYNFDDTFVELRELLKKSDYVVANLETPLAGKDAVYTRDEDMYSFNTPDEFAVALKRAGINLVLTANNHCYDRGEQGLIRTLQVLDKIGLEHTGTYENISDCKPYYVKTKDFNFAVISCTASTNESLTRETPGTEHINLLQKQKISKLPLIKRPYVFVIKHIIGRRRYMILRKTLGIRPQRPEIDNEYIESNVKPYMDRIREQIEEAKNNTDMVFVCPHMGGQFNTEPGEFSKRIMKQLVEAGASAVIASHPHIIQPYEIIDDKYCFYSTGNVSMSQTTPYILTDNHPEIGEIIHFYCDKEIKRITKTKIVIKEDDNKYIRILTDGEENCIYE